MSALLPTVAACGGSVSVIVSTAGILLSRALRRIAKDVVDVALKDIAQDVTGLKVKLASETGGNSNGLRQALNEVKRDVGDIRVDVAHLKGAASVTQQAPPVQQVVSTPAPAPAHNSNVEE